MRFVVSCGDSSSTMTMAQQEKMDVLLEASIEAIDIGLDDDKVEDYELEGGVQVC